MKKLTLILFFLPTLLWTQTPNEILKKAVNYHDPNGEWKALKATFSFTETRPDASDRNTTLELNNAMNWHKINRNNEEIYEVDGYGNVKILKGDKDEERGKTLRSFYVYLWGLPMKLLDKGTPMVNKIVAKKIDNKSYVGVEVAYEKETYTFFFDPLTYQMVEYQFFKNDDPNSGELIKLEGEVKVGNMRIPKERRWYDLSSNKYLGTDILTTAQ